MFRVHLPSISYAKSKEATYYGSDVFLKAYFISQLINKSALLHYRVGGDNNAGFIHSWAPEHGLSEDPEEPDHPPWSHNPTTGNLIMKPDGTAFGHHPIDYIHKDLSEKYGPDAARGMIDNAIDRYNKKHAEDSHHLLPGFDSPEWRKVFAGDYIDREMKTEDRQIRGDTPLYEGGPRPLLTYALNRGNIDLPGADQGTWIDSGHVHFHKELGEEMASQGIPRSDYQNLPYVQYSSLKPEYLTDNLVVSWNKSDAAAAGRSGLPPERAMHPVSRQQRIDASAHGEIHPHQVAALMPDAMFARRKGKGGGPRRRDAEGNPVEFTGQGMLDKLNEAIKGANVDLSHYSEEDLRDIANTPMMEMLLNRTNSQHGKGGGASKGILEQVYQDIGTHHTDDTYAMALQHVTAGDKSTAGAGYHGTARKRAREIVANMSNAAIKRRDQGMDSETAIQQIAQEMREHPAWFRKKGTHEEKEGLRDKTEHFIGQLLGSSGHESYSMSKLPEENLPERYLPHGYGERLTETPEHWQKRIVGTSDLAPPRNTRATMPTTPPPPQVRPPVAPAAPPMAAPAPVAPMAAPAPAPAAPQVIPVPQMRGATPMEQAWQQMRGQPSDQTFFDIGTGGLVQRSFDVASGLDDIRKKMGYFDGFLRGYQDE